MKAVLTGKEMKSFEKKSMEEYKIPSLVLMERAALFVADEAENMLREAKAGKVFVACGFGNNGADGLAAARMLFLRGYEVKLLFPEEEGKRSEECILQAEITEKLGIPTVSLRELEAEKQIKSGKNPFGRSEKNERIDGLIIDALFGIGLSRNLEGGYAKLADWINGESHWKKLAVDIPSGISSDTGAVLGCAVKADRTVTFGAEKIGQALFPGREYCGKLTICDIGLVPEHEKENAAHVQILEKTDLTRIPIRMPDSNKGTFGKVLVIAGAKNMAGAAWLSAKAAYRTGAGLVKIFTPEENRVILQEKLPEAILSTYDTAKAANESEAFARKIARETEWADVIVLGPGIGMEDHAGLLVENVLKNAYVPIVLDADALNLAAECEELTGYFTENIIVTPHMKEMSRLTGTGIDELKENPVRAARDYADQYGVVCVLKDAATVIAGRDGKTFINASGTPAMAKGGSGDVLTGVIAGLLALGLDETEAAALGVYVHGLAGESAAKDLGVHALLAGELSDYLSGKGNHEN